MRALQPYQRQKKIGEHPLRLLAEYTNHAKHQAPVRFLVASLTDDEVLHRLDRLAAAVRDPESVASMSSTT